MARYRKVYVQVWGDAKFRSLSDAAKLLWMRLLTGPETTNVPGVIPVGRAALAEALGWSAEGFAKGFDELVAKGMAKADWDARLVWLPGATKYNSPESPNVIRSWKTTWDLVPECSLKVDVYHALRAFVEGLREPFHKGFTIALPKGSPNQDQDQEQEQEQEQEQDLGESTHPLLEPKNETRKVIGLLPPTSRAKTKSVRVRKTLLADGWTPSPEVMARLKAELQVDPSPCIQAMIDWSISKAERRADWDRTFANWVRKDADDGKLAPLPEPPKQRDLGYDPNDKSGVASEESKQILRDAVARLTQRIDDDNARVAEMISQTQTKKH